MNERRKMSCRWFVVAACLVAVTVACTARAADKPSEEEIQKMAEAMPEKATVKPAKPRKLLIFCLSQGFRHSAIPYGAKAIEMMGEKTGAYTSLISDDMAMFTPLNGYGVTQLFHRVIKSNDRYVRILTDAMGKIEGGGAWAAGT